MLLIPFITYTTMIMGTSSPLIIVQDKMGIYRTNLAVAGGVVNSPELVRMEVNITKTDF